MKTVAYINAISLILLYFLGDIAFYYLEQIYIDRTWVGLYIAVVGVFTSLLLIGASKK